MNTKEKIVYGKQIIKTRQDLLLSEILDIIEITEENHGQELNSKNFVFYAISNAYYLGYVKGTKRKQKQRYQ